MTTKKKTTTRKKKDPVPDAPITIETIKTLVTRALEDPARGVPALIGPPQWGKTHYIREWLQEAGIKDIVMVNPQTDLPEDVAGWPVRTGNTLDFTQPSIIPPATLKKKNWGLFIDELDKSRDDTLSSMLTLLNPSERRLRRTVIPNEVPVIVAMNEPRRQLPEPLIARLLFVPFPPVGFTLGHGMEYLSGALTTPAVEIPERPHAPGSYFKLKSWLSVPEFSSDPALRKAVVSGLFPAKAVPAVLEALTDTPVDYSIEWAKRANPREVLLGLYEIINTIDPAKGTDIPENAKYGNSIMAVLKERAVKEKDEELERVLVFLLYSSDHWQSIGREADPKKLRALGKKAAREYAKQQKEATK